MTSQPVAEPATEPDTRATVLVTRVVEPGREDTYRRRLARLLSAAEASPGNLGTVVLVPTAEAPGAFRLIHHFADAETLSAWENSEARRTVSAEADEFSTAQRQEQTGLETWFSIPETTAQPPPKWKMALATFPVTYLLTSLIIPREQAWLPKSWNFCTANVITNVLLAVLMTYLFMPAVARLRRRWLY